MSDPRITHVQVTDTPQGLRVELLIERTPLIQAESAATERPPRHDPDYGTRRGYDPHFLGVAVPMPEAANPAVLARAANGDTVLPYHNFSIAMHARRRLALFTASNVSTEPSLRRPEPGRDYSRAGLGGLLNDEAERWFPDPRLDERFQLPDIFLRRDNGLFDRGHIVRRDDVAWGATYEALRMASGDSFHLTNCAPQVAGFNRSALGRENWGDLENLVMAEARAERLCVLAGPVLDAADEVMQGRGPDGTRIRARIPARFWKVVVAREGNGLAAFGFVLEQEVPPDLQVEFAVPPPFRPLMEPLPAIARMAGLRFAPALLAADRHAHAAGARLRARLPASEAAEHDHADPDEDHAETEGIEIEAPASWRLAAALATLRAQVDARSPTRRKHSDGTIGDAAHASRASDHNPWVRDGATGIVTALDLTHDPGGGCDAGLLAEAFRAGRDPRVKYVIWNHRIMSATVSPWTWRPYAGANPHTKHIHVSVRPEKAAFDDARPWSA